MTSVIQIKPFCWCFFFVNVQTQWKSTFLHHFILTAHAKKVHYLVFCFSFFLCAWASHTSWENTFIILNYVSFQLNQSRCEITFIKNLLSNTAITVCVKKTKYTQKIDWKSWTTDGRKLIIWLMYLWWWKYIHKNNNKIVMKYK